MNQFYKAEILTEYVIRGNTAVLKCSIPSFVADYVAVEAWIADDGTQLLASNQDYGNFRLPRVTVKCEIFGESRWSLSFSSFREFWPQVFFMAFRCPDDEFLVI